MLSGGLHRHRGVDNSGRHPLSRAGGGHREGRRHQSAGGDVSGGDVLFYYLSTNILVTNHICQQIFW